MASGQVHPLRLTGKSSSRKMGYQEVKVGILVQKHALIVALYYRDSVGDEPKFADLC